MPHSTPEYKRYQIIEHWKPINEVIMIKDLTDKKHKLAPLFSCIYKKTKEAYYHFPDRRDGQNSFIHPLNLVWDLKLAGVKDQITLCAGLLHDYVEESVDLYKKEQKIKSDKEGIKTLDEYEKQIFFKITEELTKCCKKNKLDEKIVDELIQIVKLLTRHKRHFYYRSISEIFNYKDEKIKEKAMQIKLADRIHNIQSLETFDIQGKTYQCFKNLFILNNTKRFIQEKYGEKDPTKIPNPTELLFKKCCKATYDAYLNVCHLCIEEGIKETESMLQLAFRKFVHEKGGLWTVTKLTIKEKHPMRLYFEVIRKYDTRLHQEWDKFKDITKDEKDYCKKFFYDFNFNEKQIEAIVNYKDAYSLKEVVARLLYKKNYVISGFGCSDLCSRKMVCMRI